MRLYKHLLYQLGKLSDNWAQLWSSQTSLHISVLRCDFRLSSTANHFGKLLNRYVAHLFDIVYVVADKIIWIMVGIAYRKHKFHGINSNNYKKHTPRLCLCHTFLHHRCQLHHIMKCPLESCEWWPRLWEFARRNATIHFYFDKRLNCVPSNLEKNETILSNC